MTVPSKELGLAISRELILTKVAACAHIFPQGTSVYQWQGKMEESEEYLLMIKTRRTLVDEVIRLVKENHPYECPEIISMPIENGYGAYMKWVMEQTKEGE